MPNILIQIIGFTGMVFLVLSFQQQSRNRILTAILIGQVLFLFHFILLDAWTAVGMNLVGSVRTIVFRFREERRWAGYRFWPALFIILFWSAGLVAWEAWYSLLPVTAMTIETIGLWMRNPSRIRIINLFPHPPWFIYNLIKASYPGMACEILIFTSIVTAIVRLDFKKKRPANP